METLELLDQYIDNQLAPSEARQLENTLQENAELQRLLDSVIIARKAVRLRAITLKVKDIHKQYIDEVRTEPVFDNVRELPVRRHYDWVLRIAASILIGLFGYTGYQFATVDPAHVYEDKFISYQFPIPRGTSESISRLSSSYSAGNYAATIREASTLKNKVPSDYFLTGMAYLQQHDYDQAINTFTYLININKKQNTSYFNDETEYYLALAYLGDGRVKEAIPLFQKIHNSPRHLFSESVTTLDLVKLNLLRLKK